MTREEALKIIEFKLGRGKEAERLGFHNAGVYSWRGRISEEREALEMAISALSVPERNKGQWVKTHWGERNCPFCGHIDSDADMIDVPSNFCPNCGADMRGE